MPASSAEETPDRNAAGENRRAIEALAEALYEANNPGGVAWVKRPLIVRDPWLARARQQLMLVDKPASLDGAAAAIPTKLRDIR
jgi:hypothetical protein